MQKLLVIVLFVALCLAGCNGEKDECVTVPTIEQPVSVAVDQLQDSLVGLTTKEELVALLTHHPMVRDYIFRRTEYPSDSAFINQLFAKLTNPHMDTLLMETKRVFGDGSGLKQQFDEAFSNIKYYYPDYTPPRIETVISGLETDMFVSDTLIIVGLDFYLGRGAKYRPKMYDYLLRKYDPNDIVPCALLIYGIDDRFNKTQPNDKTVLGDMVAFGKSFYFAKHMLPCVPDSVFIWYTPEEMRGTRHNEDLIWARFIDSQVLYATSHKVKQDYLGERPITIQVGEKCPGRIGQWVGWQIVNKYADKHPNATLPQIMKAADAQKFFHDSYYKPTKR